MIVKEKGKYVVKSKDGSKKLSKEYTARKDAVKRLQEIEYFKNKDK